MARKKITLDNAEDLKGLSTSEDVAGGGGSNLFKDTDVPFLNNESLNALAQDGDKTKEKLKLQLDFMLYTITKGGHPKTKPSNPENTYYNREYKVHNLERKTTLCARTFGGNCPICNKCDELKNENSWYVAGTQKTLLNTNPTLHKFIKSLEARNKYLYPVRWKGKLYILDASWGNMQKAIDSELGSCAENIKDTFFIDEGGCSATVLLVSDSFGGQPYWKANDVSFNEGRDDITDEMMQQVEDLNLDDLIIDPDLEALDKLLLNVSMDDVEEEQEEEEKTTPVSSRRSSIRDGAGISGTPESGPNTEDDDTPWVTAKSETEAPSEDSKFDDAPVSEEDFD